MAKVSLQQGPHGPIMRCFELGGVQGLGYDDDQKRHGGRPKGSKDRRTRRRRK